MRGWIAVAPNTRAICDEGVTQIEKPTFDGRAFGCLQGEAWMPTNSRSKQYQDTRFPEVPLTVKRLGFMARRCFFSFHYQDVIDFRANVVRMRPESHAVRCIDEEERMVHALPRSPTTVKDLDCANTQLPGRENCA